MEAHVTTACASQPDGASGHHGNVLQGPPCGNHSHVWLLDTCDVAGAAKELGFTFYFILINSNLNSSSHARLVTTIPEGTAPAGGAGSLSVKGQMSRYFSLRAVQTTELSCSAM